MVKTANKKPTSRSARPVKRPNKPKSSQRTVAANRGAEAAISTLADRKASTGRAVLIHAHTGVGKTVLAIHKAPRPLLVLDCDNGLDSVIGTANDDQVDLWNPADGMEFVWEDLDAFRNYVVSGDWGKQYKAIVIDNATAGQKPIVRYAIALRISRMEAAKREFADPDIPSKQDFGKIYRMMDQWVRDLRDAKRRGCHIIFTAGTHTWFDEAEGIERISPDIEGRERKQISTHMDAVGYYEIDDEDRRVLNFAPSGATITKARLPVAMHGKILEEIVDPDFNSMIAAVSIVAKRQKKKEAAAKKPGTKKTATRKRSSS